MPTGRTTVAAVFEAWTRALAAAEATLLADSTAYASRMFLARVLELISAARDAHEVPPPGELARCKTMADSDPFEVIRTLASAVGLLGHVTALLYEAETTADPDLGRRSRETAYHEIQLAERQIEAATIVSRRRDWTLSLDPLDEDSPRRRRDKKRRERRR